MSDVLGAACKALKIDRADVIAHAIVADQIVIVVRQGQKHRVPLAGLVIEPEMPQIEAIPPEVGEVSAPESIVEASATPMEPEPIEPAAPIEPEPRKRGRRKA